MELIGTLALLMLLLLAIIGAMAVAVLIAAHRNKKDEDHTIY